jgi:invasion protein IalB
MLPSRMLRSHVRYRIAAVLATAVALVAGMVSSSWAQGTAPAVAADAAASAGTVEKIGDWELVCTAAAAAKKDDAGRCRLVQNHATDGGQTALLITVLASMAAKGPVAVVSVPKSVYLAPGIELKIDSGAAFKLLYETCNDTGCHAGFKISGDIAAALKKGQVAAYKIFDSQQKPVTVDASLKGLSKALDRLAEVSK